MTWPAIVHPSDAERPAPVPPPHSNDVVYMIQASRPLPSIDCVTTVKTLVFRNPRHLRVFNRINHYLKPFINVSFIMGCILTCGFIAAADVATGRVLAVLASIGLCVPLFTGFMVMRVDLVNLLIRTYEFWFITLNSAMTAVLLCLYLGDAARSLLPAVAFVGYLRTFLVDASCSGTRAMTILLSSGSVAVSIYVIGVAFQLIPATRSIVLLTVNGHVLGGEDVALNGLGIVLVMLNRNVYRKLTTAPRRRRVGGATAGRVRLMAYRTRIQFVERASSASHGPGPPAALIQEAAPANTVFEANEDLPLTLSGALAQDPKRKMSQLISAAPTLVLHARHVLWPSVFDLLSLSWAHYPIWILSRLALALDVAASARPQYSALASAALTTTALYCVVSLALCNRAMLTLLLQSFDVQFLVIQHTLAHFTLAYIFSWDKHCVLTLTSWLWVSWLTVIDAFTPVAKHKLAISRPFLALVFTKLLLQQCLTSFNVVYLPLQDRTLFSVRLSAKHHVVVNAIPFFLTRTFAMFWWTWRLLWRVYSQHPDELVVIQGGVEFDDYELYRKHLRRQSKRRATQIARPPRHARSIVPQPPRPN